MTPDPPCVTCGHCAVEHTHPPRGERYDGRGCHGLTDSGSGVIVRCYCQMFVAVPDDR